MKDFKIDVFRPKGCKDITKGANAVRITHIPTGKSVTCDQYKSYHKNRDIALKKIKEIIT